MKIAHALLVSIALVVSSNSLAFADKAAGNASLSERRSILKESSAKLEKQISEQKASLQKELDQITVELQSPENKTNLLKLAKGQIISAKLDTSSEQLESNQSEMMVIDVRETDLSTTDLLRKFTSHTEDIERAQQLTPWEKRSFKYILNRVYRINDKMKGLASCIESQREVIKRKIFIVKEDANELEEELTSSSPSITVLANLDNSRENLFMQRQRMLDYHHDLTDAMAESADALAELNGFMSLSLNVKM